MTLLHPLIGRPITLPDELLVRFPELNEATWRRGGVFLRLGGWLLGRSTVSGITLWRTIWLNTDDAPQAELLLHELRHVHQFQGVPLFPLRYLWCSLRHGYMSNPYEADARNYAARRLAESHLPAER